MSAIIVDTSVWINYFRAKKIATQESIDLALREGRVHVPPVVVAELLSSPMRAAERSELRLFLHELAWCDCDLDHWARVGSLRASLLIQGFSISTPDAHIAQCAIDLNGLLHSDDAIFKKIAAKAGLKLG